MKKLLLHSITFYVLFFMPSITLNAQINPNGGFETGTPGVHTGTDITGWNLQQGGTALAEFAIVTDPDSVHSGNQALRITVEAIGANTWEPQVFNTDFPVQSNTTYNVSAWAKVDIEGALASFTMGSLSPNYYEWGRMGSVELGYDWEQITFQVTTRNPESEPRGGIPIHFGLAGNQSLLPITFLLDDIEVTTESTGIDNEVIPPAEYSLNQNYPNPFNPTTTIGFFLPVSGNIRLVLCDMLGRTVQVLANGQHEAGLNEVELNLSHLASGVYLYTLEAGKFVETKKLVLMK
jgi:hypothetical protein